MLRIKLVRSPIGHNWRNRRTIAALGLRKVHQVVEQPDNPSIRGMIHHVQSMVTVEVVEGEPAGKGVKGKEVKGKAAAAPKAEPKAKKGAEKPIEEVPQPAASDGEEAEAKPKKAPAKKKVEENA
jgi:large subunit ribosomal protein L30